MKKWMKLDIFYAYNVSKYDPVGKMSQYFNLYTIAINSSFTSFLSVLLFSKFRMLDKKSCPD